MSVEENKAFIRHAYELLNDNQWDQYYQLCLPDYVEHLTSGDLSLEQSKQLHEQSDADTVNPAVSINDMVAEGDKVAVLVTFRRTQKSTNKNIEMTNANFFRIRDGRLMEGWNVTDIRLAQQLKAIPD